MIYNRYIVYYKHNFENVYFINPEYNTYIPITSYTSINRPSILHNSTKNLKKKKKTNKLHWNLFFILIYLFIQLKLKLIT